MPNKPVPAAATGLPILDQDHEYRALDIFDRVPALHTGVAVTSKDWQPHLKQGEIAIVDVADKSLQFGELYVITLSEGTPHMSLKIVQLLREEPCGENGERMGLWYGFHLKERPGLAYNGMNLRYVDGPLRAEYWPTKCVGRIVGVMQPRWQVRL